MAGETAEFDKSPHQELLEACQGLLKGRPQLPGTGFEEVRAGLFQAVLHPELRASRTPDLRRGVVGYRLSATEQSGLFYLAANLWPTSVGFIDNKDAAIHKAHEASYHSLTRIGVFDSEESPWHQRTLIEYTPAYLGGDRQVHPDHSKPAWYVCTLSRGSIDGRGEGALVEFFVFSTGGDFEKIGPVTGHKIELLDSGPDDLSALTQKIQALRPS